MTSSFDMATMTGKTGRIDQSDLSIVAEAVTDLATRAGILDMVVASLRGELLTDDRVRPDLDAVAWEAAKSVVNAPRPPLERARLSLVRLAAPTQQS